LTDLDNGLVGWDGQDDPLMPLNFPPATKWRLITLLAIMDFLTPLASSMFAPALGFMSKDLHNTSRILEPMVVTVFVLGFVFGPLVLAPLSEIYGRRFVLSASNVFFVMFQLGCALTPNIGALIAFRFLAGLGGSGCLAVGGGVISDLFLPHERGLATSIYAIGPVFGPIIGPVMGGFIAQKIGWRWIYWILFIASSVMTVIIMLVNRETNHSILIKRKTQRLKEKLKKHDLHGVYDDFNTPKKNILLNGLLRPLSLLFLQPAVLLVSLYISVIYGLSFLLFTTLTGVFQDTYGWQPEICGLAYLGIGFGFFCGLAVVSKISDATVIRLTRANNGIFEPEMRLPACVFFAACIPISFFWYGWSAERGVYWLVSVLGLVPFGFGMIGVFVPIQAYLIDSFPAIAASAVAASTTSRSLFGAFLPLAGQSMNASLGVGWASTVLGFITLVLIPVPALVARYGGVMRKRWSWAS
jgi:multidrug resistance protein